MDLFSYGIYLLVISVSCFARETESHGFEGYKVYRLTLQTQEQLDFLLRTKTSWDDQLAASNLDENAPVDFWTDLPIHLSDPVQPILVMISPKQQTQFLTALKIKFIKFEITIPDLAKALEEESRQTPEDRQAAVTGKMTWTAYHRYPAMETYLASLSIDYPDLVQENVVIGQSYEGRNLYVIKVGKPRADGKTKPAIWIDSNIHAREWISSATVLYMLNKLVTDYADVNSTAHRMMNEIDWFVMPVVNVDGFEFTHASPSNRMWRKSRRVNPFSPSMGSDPNRNYDYKWMVSGAVQTPSSDTYAGAYPFSEVENLFLTEAVLERRAQIKGFLSFHSHAQLWLVPWAYGDELPDDYDQLHEVGVRATDALRAVYGTPYIVGTPPATLYAAAGGTFDWAKGKAGIKYCYTPELRDKGQFGFVLPPNQIVPSGIETFAAVNVLAQVIYEEYGPTLD